MEREQRQSLLNSLLSWFAYTEYNYMENKSYKDCDPVEKLIRDIDRYYKKYKNNVVANSTAEMMTRKLKELQKLFENEIIIEGEETIPYSMQLISICLLDYLMNEYKDTGLRTRFGHIKTAQVLLTIEKQDKEIYLSTLTILNKMYKRIEV